MGVTAVRRDKLCEETIRTYYNPIYRHCLCMLKNDVFAAEDCTQTVFTLLVEKKDTLNFHQNIRGWLYAAADRICKDHMRKEQKRLSMLVCSLDEGMEFPDQTDFAEQDSVFDVLTKEEYRLIETYYETQYGERLKLAESLGLTPSQLVKKIHAIRHKLKIRMSADA